MKVLIVKMSSLGDVLHTLPALTDAVKNIPDIQFDWVVEEGFQEIPAWHSAVRKVIPIAFRRWRKHLFRLFFSKELRDFLKNLRAEKYDYVIDPQGLLKSSIVARLAHGKRIGLNKRSLTEPFARFFYQQTVDVDLKKQAVWRMRAFFAKAFGYDVPEDEPNYGIDQSQFAQTEWNAGDYVVFVHGTTWKSKHWPDSHWIALAKLIAHDGLSIRIPWGNAVEKQRAEKIVNVCDTATILPKMSLNEVAGVLAYAKAIVAVDTGLAHMAAALNVPAIALYGPTNPNRTGTVGKNQQHLLTNFVCMLCDKPICRYNESALQNCLLSITPDQVWTMLKKMVNIKSE